MEQLSLLVRLIGALWQAGLPSVRIYREIALALLEGLDFQELR